MQYYMRHQWCPHHYSKFPLKYEDKIYEKMYEKLKLEYQKLNIFWKEKISSEHKVLCYCPMCWVNSQSK